LEGASAVFLFAWKDLGKAGVCIATTDNPVLFHL